MEIIEQIDEWRKRYSDWQKEQSRVSGNGDVGESYPFVKNKRAPFTPARRALPMLNLALISSAGVYLDGTHPFDPNVPGSDLNFREIPIEVEAADLRFTAKGYDPAAVQQDLNAQVPLERLLEFEVNGIIGQLNTVFWSFSGFIPDAARLADEMFPKLIERIKRYEVQAALLIPASRLCHQSVSLVARALEQVGLPTMMLAVVKDVVESVRPPRAAFYEGELGSVAGRPNWPEHQRRILDEALRLIEPMDQPGIYQLAVTLETQVEKERGEQ
ncbi:MAG TPA: glycine/sarcosine/betaine reductase selenoprotein B family protein [Pyrinomonadaceae bacterium]|nr:glycine/sarcosine/betaine reductase selenoprotein B family protein [Pyrinomonadaceae bacterium]